MRLIKNKGFSLILPIFLIVIVLFLMLVRFGVCKLVVHNSIMESIGMFSGNSVFRYMDPLMCSSFSDIAQKVGSIVGLKKDNSDNTDAKINTEKDVLDVLNNTVGNQGVNVSPGKSNSNLPLIWQDNPKLSLCFDSKIKNCFSGYGLLDPLSNKKFLLGAFEYCQYLKQDGKTISTTTIQNIWRLPSKLELLDTFKIQLSSNGTISTTTSFSKKTDYWCYEEKTLSYGISCFVGDSVGFLSSGVGHNESLLGVRCVR